MLGAFDNGKMPALQVNWAVQVGDYVCPTLVAVQKKTGLQQFKAPLDPYV